jgi:hypothetical protein
LILLSYITKQRFILMRKAGFSLVKELDPQVITLLESFQAMAAQQPASDHILSTEEKIAASRQMVSDAIGRGIPCEEVSRIEDVDIPGPGGKLPYECTFRIRRILSRNRRQLLSTTTAEVLSPAI